MVPFKDHFSDRASGYASHRPSYPPELIEYFASVAPSHGLAWDCGCGSGQMSVPLASAFDLVIATDASAEQVAHATPHAKVEYRAEPAERTSIKDASVDLTVVAQSAHWFDLPKFYDEVRRVSKPAATLALVTYNLLEVTPEIDRLVRTFYSTLRWPPERKLVEEGYASLPFPFEEVKHDPFFMRSDWTADQLLGYVGTWSGLRGVDVTPFERELRLAWGEETRPVRWPIAMRIGTVR